MVRLKEVAFTVTGNHTIFQFLMVRLKALQGVGGQWFLEISIPYGAIKSYLSNHKNDRGGNFNSLWCD